MEKKGRRCGASKSSTGFVCTRPKGHKGQHSARGLNGAVLAKWGR